MKPKEDAMGALDLDEPIRQAVEELQRIIAARYPTTTFALARSPAEPATIHLLALADVEDPDEVGDLVVDRVVALQVDAGIPIHVIPLQSPQRHEAELVAARSRSRHRSSRAALLWEGAA